MVSDERVHDWSDITLRDVALAYHKSKCDAFFERSTVDAVVFAEYEENLESNLRALLARVRAGEAGAVLASGSQGFKVVPKKLGWSARRDSKEDEAENAAKRETEPPFVWPSAQKRFEYLKRRRDAALELRACARFSVDTHIVGALWINLIGHRIDEVLERHAYGSRLRRYRSPTEPGHLRSKYHLEARGSFEPYIHPYKRWRSNAMRSVRNALDEDKQVVVLMLDLSAYYHSVDPRFITTEEFITELGRGPGIKTGAALLGPWRGLRDEPQAGTCGNREPELGDCRVGVV